MCIRDRYRLHNYYNNNCSRFLFTMGSNARVIYRVNQRVQSHLVTKWIKALIHGVGEQQQTTRTVTTGLHFVLIHRLTVWRQVGGCSDLISDGSIRPDVADASKGWRTTLRRGDRAQLPPVSLLFHLHNWVCFVLFSFIFPISVLSGVQKP